MFGWLKWLAIFVGLMFWLTGCHATGWEPGPVTPSNAEISAKPAQPVDLTLPGAGPDGQALSFKFEGERDTTLVINGMVGDGIHWPSIASLTLDRSASGPLGTRGGQQFAIEGQRIEYAIQGLERATAALTNAAAQLVPLIGSMHAQAPPATQPTYKDRLLEMLLLKFEDELTKPK